MKLHVLPLGLCCLPIERILPGLDDGVQYPLPVAGYLIELDTGEFALVDTGMSDLHAVDPGTTWRGHQAAQWVAPVVRPEDTLTNRLQQLGLSTHDIAYVVNTHLHFDHAGNNALLDHATFFVQRDHYQFAKGNPSFPNQHWNLPTLRYELLDGDTEIVPHLRVVATPGHAPGHQSVVVELAETGVVILCGDAISLEAELTAEGAWSNQADPPAARASAQRLQQIAETEGGTLMYSHDWQQARTLRWAPDGYYA